MARATSKVQLDAAIAADTQPHIPRNGLGIVLNHTGQRLTLVNSGGVLTKNGEYYYQKTNQQPPSKFDLSQEPQRVGNSLNIRLLDGSSRAVSRYDDVKKGFVNTQLGKRFFAHKLNKFVVLFPSDVILTRTNGSLYIRSGDYFASTAALDLGEIAVKASLSEEAQLAEVKRQARNWLAQQPTVSGEKILMAGYQTWRLADGEWQYNRLSHSSTGDAQAVMHRPLTEGKPWSFPWPGVAPESLEDTQGECVTHQLSKYIRFRGTGEHPFTKNQLCTELEFISQDLYAEDDDCAEILACTGFTAAAIERLCRYYSIPIHVKHGKDKVFSFIPEISKFETLCVVIWGSHLFTIADPTVKSSIAREQLVVGSSRDWVLQPIMRSSNRGPGFNDWELFGGELRPGHYYSRNLKQARTELHRHSICPMCRSVVWES